MKADQHWSAATRAQQKKMLLLQGALYRLEMAAAMAGLKADLQPDALLGLAKSGLKRSATLDNIAPVLGRILPLLAGAGIWSGRVRRLSLIAGVATAAWAAWRRRRDRSASEDDEGSKS